FGIEDACKVQCPLPLSFPRVRWRLELAARDRRRYVSTACFCKYIRAAPSPSVLLAWRCFAIWRWSPTQRTRNIRRIPRSRKTTMVFTTYINFARVFPKFTASSGLAGGLVTFAFDPDYANNHKFYTVHSENPGIAGSAAPTNGYLTGLNLTGYATTAAINPPVGTVAREAVLIEWTDSNITNSTFEGTARELLRVGFYTVIHPMGDLLFNPLALAGDADYGNLYIANGDGGAGETSGAEHTIPQRLDAL